MDALRLSLLIFGALVIGGVYLWTSHLQHKKRQQRVGWEGPDSATIQNMELDHSDISPHSQDYHFIPEEDHTPDVGKVFTHDVAKERLGFNDTGEFRELSHTINEAKESQDDDVEVPSVFVKPKIYKSRLDETKSHIKAVQERERMRQAREPVAKPRGMVVVVNVLARPGLEFKGEQVLSAIKQAGLEYGDMNIFHKYQQAEDGGKVLLYSLANIVNPGTFDMQNMHVIGTPGLSLFMQLPGPVDGVKTFEKMLATAQDLKKRLDGELCDETRSALTYQTISHLKDQIKEYCFKYQQA